MIPAAHFDSPREAPGRVTPACKDHPWGSSLPAAGGFDFGDVDFAHLHHRRKSALRLVTARSHGIDQHARSDLPGNAPAVPAPPADAFLAAIADDGVPVSV